MSEEEYLAILQRTVRMVFRNVLNTDFDVDGPLPGRSLLIKPGILSLMKITGDIKGEVSVHSNRDTAVYIATKIADNNFNGTMSEIESGLGELCNLISGTIKRLFMQYNKKFTFTCPEIYHISDKNYEFIDFKTNNNYHIIVGFITYVIYIDISLHYSI
ncbi:MAG: chemotaxis protein CheX [Spirochaetales bacterium]|nr:chemotaxis protein CheX [Spirochaetales bacterium]